MRSETDVRKRQISLPVITNPKLLVAFPHVIFGALATGAFFVVGISAWSIS